MLIRNSHSFKFPSDFSMKCICGMFYAAKKKNGKKKSFATSNVEYLCILFANPFTWRNKPQPNLNYFQTQQDARCTLFPFHSLILHSFLSSYPPHPAQFSLPEQSKCRCNLVAEANEHLMNFMLATAFSHSSECIINSCSLKLFTQW